MHPYYEKEKDQYRKEAEGFLRLIRSELEQETGTEFPRLMEEILEVYERDMLERFPFIGGKKASGTANLTGAFSFVAMGEVCRKKYGMTLETWGYLTTVCYERFFGRFPKPVLKLAGKAMKHPAIITPMLRKKDRKNAALAARYPGSFETETCEGTPEYPVQYRMKVCPLADFARTCGYEEYMPYLCNLDYVMFKAMGVPFYREHTCASGDGYCDFKLRAGAPVNEAWPCHQLTPGDPLK